MTTPQPWKRPIKGAARTPEPVDTAPWSQRGSAVTTVEALPGVLPGQNLKSWANWRAFVHQVTPVIVTSLVGVGIVTDNQAVLWVPIAFAIIDPLLSAMNSTDKIRQIIYGVAGLLQVGGLATGLVTGLAGGSNGVIAAGVGAGVTILSSFLARFYVPTSTMQPAAPPPTDCWPTPGRNP